MSYYVDRAGFEFTVLLLLPPECSFAGQRCRAWRCSLDTDSVGRDERGNRGRDQMMMARVEMDIEIEAEMIEEEVTEIERSRLSEMMGQR